MADLALPDRKWTSSAFPLLHNHKLKDQDVLVHSLGCSVWNSFGHKEGFMAIVECPAPGTHGADIRSDSGWFFPNDDKPQCLIEFERYDGSDRGQDKLEEKLKNLMEAAQRWEFSPKTLVLSAWNQGIVKAPNVEQLKSICQQGFISSTGVSVKVAVGTRVVFSRFLFVVEGANIILDSIHNEVLI